MKFRIFHEGRAITAICLFWKPDLLTCFHCEKNQDDCEVWRLNRTSALRRYEGNCDIRNRPEQIHDFLETSPRFLRLVQVHFPVWPDCACEAHVRDFLETLKLYGYLLSPKKPASFQWVAHATWSAMLNESLEFMLFSKTIQRMWYLLRCLSSFHRTR